MSHSLRRADTPEAKKIWDDVDRAAYRAPLCQMPDSPLTAGRECHCDLCTAKARIVVLEDALRKARPLLQDIVDTHCDPSDGEYHGCDTDPCAWCAEARELLGEAK